MKRFHTNTAGILVFAMMSTLALGSVAAADEAPGSVVTPTGNRKVTGTVVSDENNVVVIMSATGERTTFRLEENAFVPLNMVVGSPVEVTYVPSGSELVASRILMAYPDQQNLASTQSGSGAYYAQGNNTGYDASQRYDGDRLPSTAGPLPLTALMGLASLAAGVGIRNIRRR
jgi:hypothetical protein